MLIIYTEVGKMQDGWAPRGGDQEGAGVVAIDICEIHDDDFVIRLNDRAMLHVLGFDYWGAHCDEPVL
jgi:hypothetical protein